MNHLDSSLPRPVRRVVTGHDAAGRSVVAIDAPSPHGVLRSAGNGSTLLWVTDETPARVDGQADRAARTIGVPPPPRGTVFRIAEFPAGHATGPLMADPADRVAALREMGVTEAAASSAASGATGGTPPRHPDIHRTATLDYVTVLDGEIVLLLDEGEVTLRAGDVVVQQATNHAWVNRSAAPARLAMVFIDAAV